MSQLQLNLSCDNRNKRTSVTAVLTAYKLALLYDMVLYVHMCYLPLLPTYLPTSPLSATQIKRFMAAHAAYARCQHRTLNEARVKVKRIFLFIVV